MPCGCFGGGGKKKGSSKGSEGPPKPPKILAEEPLKQQQIEQKQTLAYTSQPESLPLNGTTLSSGNGPVQLDTPLNCSSVTASTPQSDPQSMVDGSSTRSSGARSRAELCAKRREFFRPLYDVSLTGSNQRFATPRSSHTLPYRGKKGAFLMGDESGYFTAEGRYVAAEEQNPDGIRYGGSGEHLPHDMMIVGATSGNLENDNSPVDRPNRPTSQPSGVAGQWEEIVDEEHAVPQDEFHQKHLEIIQHQQHKPSVPPPPPPPKEINPHFIEFQEKHHKILHDPESHNHHRNTDTEETQKLAEGKLTELDKLHNEVHDHYAKRMKNGPVDVDSLVEKYTEDRWKKMVEVWESEGLVVEGGMVIVDDKGIVVEREMKASNDGGHVVEKVTRIVEKIGDNGETITERIEKDGDTIVKVVETEGQYVFNGDGPETVMHTEEILVENFVQNEPLEGVTVTTIVTPPTPQIDISTRVTPLANVTAEQIAGVERDIAEFERYESEMMNSDDFANEVEESETEPLVELIGDDRLNNIQQVVERERIIEQEDTTVDQDPSLYRVSPPPSPPVAEEPMVPTTCTPPPSPQRNHEQKSSPVLEKPLTSVCSSLTEDDDDDIAGNSHLVLGKGSATPPPSPPLQVTEHQP